MTGLAYPARPSSEPKPLRLPRIKTDPLYHRQWMLAHSPADPDDAWQPDAAVDSDQIGFLLPP